MSQAGASSGGGGSSNVKTLTGNSGGAVGPDGVGNISVVGSGSISVIGTPGTNTITIGASASNWIPVSTNTLMDPNTSYSCVSPGGTLLMQVPVTANVGDNIEISLDGATAFKITQPVGANITYLDQTTTTGLSGYIQTITAGCTIRLVCLTANVHWKVMSSTGNFGIL